MPDESQIPTLMAERKDYTDAVQTDLQRSKAPLSRSERLGLLAICGLVAFFIGSVVWQVVG